MSWADDRLTHLAVGSNTALCVKASGDPRPDSSPRVWGHWLTMDHANVDCPDCLAWMHA